MLIRVISIRSMPVRFFTLEATDHEIDTLSFSPEKTIE